MCKLQNICFRIGKYACVKDLTIVMYGAMDNVYRNVTLPFLNFLNFWVRCASDNVLLLIEPHPS